MRDKIEGIIGSISSKYLSKNELYNKVESDILPKFKRSSNNLTNSLVRVEKGTERDNFGYYNFEIKTKELQEKLQ